MTITKTAVVKQGKIILDAPEFQDGDTVTVQASTVDSDMADRKALSSFFEAFREVAESGDLNDLPPDYSESYKEQSRLK